jgi:hypothetical protein
VHHHRPEVRSRVARVLMVALVLGFACQSPARPSASTSPGMKTQLPRPSPTAEIVATFAAEAIGTRLSLTLQSFCGDVG